jgi:DnaJ-class molecular chaperone
MEVQKYNPMDIQRCFEVLELDPDAGVDDAKQAYRDMVNIWHPDRFSSNPRLQKKSEERLKEINIAYETIRPVLSAPKSDTRASEQQIKPEKKPEPETGAANQPKNHTGEPATGTPDKTEAFVEAGTGLVLNLFSSLYSAVRRLVKDAVTEITSENSGPPRQNDTNGKNCRRRGPGKGSGMGNRGGGGGRGRGRR